MVTPLKHSRMHFIKLRTMFNHAIIAIILIGTLLQSAHAQFVEIDSAYDKAIQLSDDSLKVKTLNDISYALVSKDPSKGVEVAELALQVANKIGWLRGSAAASGCLGINYNALGKYEKALEHEGHALEVYSQLGFQRGVAAMQSNLTLVYMNLANYVKALEFGLNALQTFQAMGSEMNAAVVSENIGTIYFRQKNYTNALDYYNRSLKIQLQNGDSSSVARTYGNIGIVLNAQGSFNEALKKQLHAARLNQSMGKQAALQINFVNAGNAHLNLNSTDSALHYFNKALNIARTIENLGSIATTTGNIGLAYLNEARQNPDNAKLSKAIQALSYAIEQCRHLKFYEPIIEFSASLAEAYELNHDFANALKNYKVSVEIKDSIHSIENKEMLANIEAQHKIELLDKQLKLRDHENQIQALEIENKRDQLIIILLVFVLVVSALILSTFMLRRYKKTNRELLVRNKAQLQQIEDQMKALTEHSKVLGEIAYMQAHYVRSPVATLLGLSKLFNHQNLSDPTNYTIIQNIEGVALKLDEAVREVIEKENNLKR